jgi:hypothetical protein
VSGVDLHPVEAAAVNSDDSALHVNQVVFTHSILWPVAGSVPGFRHR